MKHAIENDDDIRGSMARLPRFLQPALTWLTSHALPGQQPLFRNTPWTQIGTAFGSMGAGVALSAFGVRLGLIGFPLVVIGWTLTAAGARYLQTNILHQGSHDRLTGHPGIDLAVGELASASAVIATPAQYRKAHKGHHDLDTFATVNDPDFRLFRTLGIEPGLSKAELWRRLWWAIVGPRSHFRYFRARLRSNLAEAPVWHRLLFLAVQGTIAAVVGGSAGWTAYAIAWVLPIVPLFQISGLLQYLSEHVWLRRRQEGETPIEHASRLTVARFTGERAPSEHLPPLRSAIAWIGWTTRMLTLHLFIRLFVLQGHLGVHDFHHWNPLTTKWANSIYERRRQVDSGEWRFRDYRGVWGLYAALDLALTAISEFPALPPSSVDADEERQEFQTM